MALLVDLVRVRSEQLVEFVPRELNHARLSHPAAIVAFSGHTLLVGTHARQRLLVGLRVIPERDEVLPSIAGHCAVGRS